jgi:gliding motility-associated lipoprotein GldD
MKAKIILYTILLLFAFACGKKNKFIPKPIGHFRIEFEQKEYQQFNFNWPYQFEYPVYAKLVKEENRFSEPFWINIAYAKHNAQIHLSYKPIKGNLEQLINDSHELAYKHAIKASAINEKAYSNPNNHVFGTLFEIKGNAASPMQFHLTDSVSHFLRGSFYISETPNYDSLIPVIQFVEADILHLIETLNWN